MKLRTGARLGELLGVRYADIDFDGGIWIVSVQWTREGALAEPKTKKSTGRRVPLGGDSPNLRGWAVVRARRHQLSCLRGDVFLRCSRGPPPREP